MAKPKTQQIVVVRRGQTLFSIARAHKVPVEAIIAANGLDDPNLIWPGQRLIIPTGPINPSGPVGPINARSALPRPEVPPARRTARIVVVKPGETVSSISRANGVPVDAVIAANRLRNPHSIWPGQALVIPALGSVPRTGAYAGVPRVSIEGGFLWPARGYITSHFGWRRRNHHNGIDIAATWGSPILAPRAGQVTFAGWYAGYGKMIVIGHGNGLSTRYAHASSLAVKMGDVVKPGQVLGRVGCTGACWGTHLHFEVRLQGRPIDPLPYLD